MESNQLIGLFVKQINCYEPDFFFNQSFVEAYLIDQISGLCIKANSSNTNLASYICPFTLANNKSDTRQKTQIWRKLLIIDKNISELKSNSKLIIFEICKNDRLTDTEETGRVRIAFAFLIPMAPGGSMNTNQDLKLQLYKIKKDCNISHQDCNIYHLYSKHKLKRLNGNIQISVKEVVPVKIKQLNHEKPQSKSTCVAESPTKIENALNLKPITKSIEWSRLPTQSCKVPNKISHLFSPSKNGYSCLRFSRSGVQVAAATLSKIIVQDIVSGLEVATLKNHFGFIYELDWSFDDKLLLSVSNDCRGVIWDVMQTAAVFILPHPSYIYCGRWFGNDQQIVTGGKDHLIRYWRRSDDGFCLIEEMGNHLGYISSLATHLNSLVISGDSVGCITVRKYENDRWAVIKSLSFPETSKKVIDSILIHSSCRRIIVSVRSKSSYLIDFISGIILQTYKPSVNTFVRSVPSLTPCESYFFSFCQNGEVNVWEVNTGKVFATYSNLLTTDRLTELSGCIHYHPYEHIVGIVALVSNYPILILKYEGSDENDAERLGLIQLKKSINCCTGEKKSVLPLKKNNILTVI